MVDLDILAIKPNHLGKLFATYAVYRCLPTDVRWFDNALCFEASIREDYINVDGGVFVQTSHGYHNQGVTPFSCYSKLDAGQLAELRAMNERTVPVALQL